MATIYEVARLAGVSTATVSRALNRSGYVSEAVRQRVHRAAAELSFVPNRAARSLVNKRTFSLALLIPDIVNPFFPALARGAEDAASAAHHNLILCNTDHQKRRESQYVAMLREKRVDGLICAGTTMGPQQLAALLRNGFPVVAVDRSLRGREVDTVVCDNVRGAELAIAHLVAVGHRRIALITGPLAVSTARERLSGARRALDEAGLEVAGEWIVEGDYQLEGGYRAAKHLFQKVRERSAGAVAPLGLFAANDLMAAGAIMACREEGLSVPEDVSVIGFDDIALAKALSPPLTTIAQPAYELGRTAAEALLARIADPGRSVKTVTLVPALVVRDSTQTLVPHPKEV